MNKRVINVNKPINMARIVGVISDTHGQLPASAKKAFGNVDLIIHAGDIGGEDVIKALETIAPVIAVRGNMDGDAFSLYATQALDFGESLVYVIHDLQRLDIDVKKADIKAVIHGHLHKPDITKKNGVLYVNPGSVAHPRNSKPSVAKLFINKAVVTAEIVPLG